MNVENLSGMEPKDVVTLQDVYAQLRSSAMLNEQVIGKRGLSLQEACIYIGGVSRPTLYGLLRDGSLRSYKIGRKRYFLKAELDAFLDERVGADDDLLG